jgi:hypothetical protein
MLLERTEEAGSAADFTPALIAAGWMKPQQRRYIDSTMGLAAPRYPRFRLTKAASCIGQFKNSCKVTSWNTKVSFRL